MTRTLGFEVIITNLCNFRCQYCIEHEYSNYHEDPVYNNSFRYNKEELYEFIDKILRSNFFKDNYDVLDIHLWGGEPTLDMNFIFDIVNRYIDDDKTVFMISTNGYKINKLLEFLNDSRIQNKNKHGINFFNLQISYDGKIITDLKRKTINNISVTNDIIESINYARNNNINHVLKSTITYDTLKYIYESYHDVVNNLKQEVYFPTIDYRHDEIDKLTEDDITQYFSELKAGLFKIAKDEINYIREHKQSRFYYFNYNKAECCAGGDMITVDIDGKIYSCHGCLSIPSKTEHCVGSIYDDNIIDLINKKRFNFYENKYKTNNICSDCDAVFCLRCNSAKYEVSDKDEYYDRWFDYKSQPFLCRLYKFISNIARAVNKKAFIN